MSALYTNSVKQVGRYRIFEEIGRGAAGIVYKAEDTKKRRPVALKAVRVEPAIQDESALEAVRALTALDHPHLAEIYEIFREGQQVYVAFEYVPGFSLEKMLQRLALPDKPALLHGFEQAAQALDYADASGFIHRDVKPSNIIFKEAANTEGVIVKITDYGVSRLVSHEVTSSGGLVGTPSYLSPEEIQGTTIDGRSDQFSLAVVIYEVLSGTKPFIADSLPAVFYQICHEAARPIEQINKSLTPEVGQALQGALAKTPSQRFPSCSDFVEALASALRQIPGWGTTTAAGVKTAVPIAIPPLMAETRTETPRHLPSLPQRRALPIEETRETPRHSPLKLLAAMLVLSAIVIALTFFFEQWHWHSRFTRPTKSSQAAEATTTPSSSQKQSDNAVLPTREPKAQRGRTEAQSISPSKTPLTSNPIAGPPPVSKPVVAPRHQESSPMPGAVAAVDLLSEPPGATIIVDGDTSKSCRAPCTMSLTNGRHTATVQLSGYNLARRVFEVPQSNSLITPLSQMAGTLVVTSQPAGSPVFVDNKPRGQTPQTLHLQAGPHKLVLTNGQMQHQETIEIVAGEMMTRSLRWQ